MREMALSLLLLPAGAAAAPARKTVSLDHALHKLSLTTASRAVFKTQVLQQVERLPWMLQRPRALESALSDIADGSASELVEHNARRMAYALAAEPSELVEQGAAFARTFNEESLRRLAFSARVAAGLPGVPEMLRRIRENLELFDAFDGIAWAEMDAASGKLLWEAENGAAADQERGQLIDARARFAARGAPRPGPSSGPATILTHPQRDGH